MSDKDADKLIPDSPDTSDYTKDDLYQNQLKANLAPISEDGPLDLFSKWLAEAKEKEINDPNAMALATVDEDGLPDIRMVLLKGLDARGFVFYSHKSSAKGRQLAVNPKAALNFHWKSLRRQVRIRGHVQEVSRLEVQSYFATRARDSRIGAWASAQSSPMQDKGAFERAIDRFKRKFEGKGVPLPPGWTGWRVVPQSIEFWRDRPFRLHDRVLFARESDDSPWTKSRLYP